MDGIEKRKSRLEYEITLKKKKKKSRHEQGISSVKFTKFQVEEFENHLNKAFT